jgi:hypothetical protein
LLGRGGEAYATTPFSLGCRDDSGRVQRQVRRNANMKLVMAVGIGLAFALWLLAADMLRRNRDEGDVRDDADREPDDS